MIRKLKKLKHSSPTGKPSGTETLKRAASEGLATAINVIRHDRDVKFLSRGICQYCQEMIYKRMSAYKICDGCSDFESENKELNGRYLHHKCVMENCTNCPHGRPELVQRKA